MAFRSRSAVCEPDCGSVEGTELDTQELGGGSWTRVDEREPGMQECEHPSQLPGAEIGSGKGSQSADFGINKDFAAELISK